MLIKSIELENFRQYKNKVRFDFSCSKDKNVTVILGENTGGKTTLVRAFKWCFYNANDFKKQGILNLEKSEELMNKSIGSFINVAVSIELETTKIDEESHELIKRTYIISRKQRFEKTKTKSDPVAKATIIEIWETSEDGYNKKLYSADETDRSSKKHKEITRFITEILPEELADYFFFWGERIENLSDKKNINKAVKDFLGLSTIDYTKEYLEYAIKDLNKDISYKTKDVNLQKINREIEETAKRIQDCQKVLDINQVEENKYSLRVQEASKEYYKVENNEKMQEKINSLKERENHANESLKVEKKNFIKYFNQDYIGYYSMPFINEAKNILDNNQDEISGWVHIDVNAIEEILKKGECICGAKIHNGSEAYKHLLGQKRLVAPNVIGGVSAVLISKMDTASRNYKRYYENLVQSEKRIADYEEQISDFEKEIAELQEKQIDPEILAQRKMKLREAEQIYKELQRKGLRLEEEIKKYSIDKQKREQEQSNAQKMAILQNKQRMKLAYAKAVLENINADYEGREKEIRSKMQEYTQEYFNQMYSGDRDIVIGSSFKIVLYNSIGSKRIIAETSPGLETVKNFAFIAALVQVAKERIIEYRKKKNGEYDDALFTEPYPLVLDAPFSQADEKHVPAISGLISNIAEQIILVVMKKDWQFAKTSLGDKVGKFYVLEKITETHTQVRELTVEEMEREL